MVNSKEIQAKINHIEETITSASGELDTMIHGFAKELESAVEIWMEAELKRQIEDNAKIINEGGAELVRAIKADFNKLIVQIPQLCEQSIGDRPTWPHHIEATPEPIYESFKKESYFPAVFRKAISHLGPLLDKYGFLKDLGGAAPSWEKKGDDIYRYAINPGFEFKKYESVKQYMELHVKQKKMISELKTMKDELLKTQALELWEKVK